MVGVLVGLVMLESLAVAMADATKATEDETQLIITLLWERLIDTVCNSCGIAAGVNVSFPFNPRIYSSRFC